MCKHKLKLFPKHTSKTNKHTLQDKIWECDMHILVDNLDWIKRNRNIGAKSFKKLMVCLTP